jgi:Ni/Co efflux regulator RcnB
VTYGSSYGPYYYSGYTPRYAVGNYYSYGPRRTVYINDYDHYGLYAPPHGYQWVRDNDRGDAILASVATGAILGLVIGAIVTD